MKQNSCIFSTCFSLDHGNGVGTDDILYLGVDVDAESVIWPKLSLKIAQSLPRQTTSHLHVTKGNIIFKQDGILVN